jgi:GAF domain-containing protein
MSLVVGSEKVPSGLEAVGDLHWGSHFCHFYRSENDLSDALVPFFREGLRHNEQCIWVTAAPFDAAAAREALRRGLTDFARYEASGQIEIVDYSDWYMRGGALVADDIVRSWLDREKSALARGFRGLRLSGNVQGLHTADAFANFAEYEARVHRAFVGHKIVALCSYALDQCRGDAVADVVRNHHFALIRQRGEWNVMRSATTLMQADEVGSDHVHHSHLVQFYEREYPTDSIAQFVRDGLDRGAAVLIATGPHLDDIRCELRQRGVDVDAAATRGTLVVLDADETLAKLVRDGQPQQALVDGYLGGLVADLRRRFGVVHAFGEMVDVLAARGEVENAVLLETQWNALLQRHPARLLCAYDLARFDADASSEQLRRVCAIHESVVSPSTAPRRDSAAELQHKTRQLALAVDRLTRLQEVTSALAETASVADVVRATQRDVCAALGASRVVVALRDDGVVADPDLRRALEEGMPAWPRDAGDSVVLPVTAGGARLAAVRVHYPSLRSFNAADRALHEDVMRQVAIALDRGLLNDESQQLRVRAEESSRAKDEFLAILGHELRNPLSPIMTALHLMRMRDASAFTREREVIERQVTHMTRLVDDLLDVSRIARGKVDLKRQRIEVADAISLAIEQTSPAFEARAHRLNVSVPRSGLVVDADPTRLAQAVANVLNNAAKYTPENVASISAWCGVATTS